MYVNKQLRRENAGGHAKDPNPGVSREDRR